MRLTEPPEFVALARGLQRSSMRAALFSETLRNKTAARSLRAHPSTARVSILAAAALGAAGAALISAVLPHAPSSVDPGLVRLLRLMAVLKALFAGVLISGVLWRLGRPLSVRRLVLYGIVVAALTSGLVLIWSLSNLVLGAVLLHGGLLSGVLLLWRDPGTALRLEAALVRRRRERG